MRELFGYLEFNTVVYEGIDFPPAILKVHIYALIAHSRFRQGSKKRDPMRGKTDSHRQRAGIWEGPVTVSAVVPATNRISTPPPAWPNAGSTTPSLIGVFAEGLMSKT